MISLTTLLQIYFRALSDLQGLVLVRCFGVHADGCSSESMHNGYRPLVASFILNKVSSSRLKTHEIMLGATAVNLRDREAFREYSRLIREQGRVAPYVVYSAEGDEVNADPVAAAVARYSSTLGGRRAREPALQALLPVCFCNSQDSGSVSGGVMWIQCDSAEACVSFRDGWAHQACALQSGRAVPESWFCPGCDAGDVSVLTTIAAGSGEPIAVSVCPLVFEVNMRIARTRNPSIFRCRLRATIILRQSSLKSCVL